MSGGSAPGLRADNQPELKCARLVADPRDFSLNLFINLTPSCATSFDATAWPYKTSHHFHDYFNDSMMAFCSFVYDFFTTLLLSYKEEENGYSSSQTEKPARDCRGDNGFSF
jgi:hypothetical protein